MSFKVQYKIKDSYFGHYLGDRENALKILFDFCKEYDSAADTKLSFIEVMTAVEKLENGEITNFQYFPYENSSSPNICLEFNSKTEEEFLKEFQDMLNSLVDLGD